MLLYITRIFLLCFLLIPVGGYCQLSDDFSDGNLDLGTVWEGHVDHFIVNANQQLQLDANEPGMSYLYTPVEFPDSIRWSGYTLYDFAPSNNNNGAIYLAIDSPDINDANGYLLRFGENGSDDAINFNRLDGGQETTLASGTLGAVSSDPAEFSYYITYDSKEIWTAEISYNGGASSVEFSVAENTYHPSSLAYFGMEATYTSSNIDNVFFDDLMIEEDLPDTNPPFISIIEVISPEEVHITFSEAMDLNSLELAQNYILDPNNQSPSQIITDAQNPTLVKLLYDPPLAGSTAYTILISGCTDIAGNMMSDVMQDFLITDIPSIGDLLLSEILFDPYIGLSDFVEIYNSSDKILSLDSVFIENQDKDERDYIQEGITMLPNTFLAVTDGIDGVIATYTPPDTAIILEQSIPSFNNSDGNVSIGRTAKNDDIIFESFSYQDDYHNTLIDDTEGVSLSRLSFSVSAKDSNNWISGVESNNYATPGYSNGTEIQFTSNFDGFVGLESEVFSPNGDGNNELLTLLFNMDKEGYVATAKVFDYRGQEIRTIANNQLIASKDFILWDGLRDDGRRASIGPYIIYISAFHTDGDVRDKKLPAVLADFLD